MKEIKRTGKKGKIETESERECCKEEYFIVYKKGGEWLRGERGGKFGGVGEGGIIPNGKAV
jgi:hypothetical protein